MMPALKVHYSTPQYLFLRPSFVVCEEAPQDPHKKKLMNVYVVNQGYPSGGVLEDFHGDTSFSSCREEGVMFTCPLGDRADSKKSPHSLVYWVVGYVSVWL